MPAELGGMGLGPTAMAAVSAEAAKVSIGPFVLNAQAPDEGNQHTLLHWATDEQKEKYLRPLCEGKARSCFAMTEPEVAGSDPTPVSFTYLTLPPILRVQIPAGSVVLSLVFPAS